MHATGQNDWPRLEWRVRAAGAFMGGADATLAPALLLVAISARALAQAARRAGYAPLAIDAFGDQDTRRTCRATYVVEGALGGFAQVELATIVAQAVRDHAPVGLLYGSG